MSEIRKHMKEVKQENDLTLEDQLEAILFQFVNLYERFSEDRQVGAKQGAEIAKFIDEFASQVSNFANLEEVVRDRIQATLDHATSKIASEIRSAATEATNKAVESSSHKIYSAAREAERVMSEYQSSLNRSQWKIFGIAALSSIATSLMIVWLLMPKPVLPLSDSDLKAYQLGKNLSEVWPKLSKKKQDWFLNEVNERS